MAGGKPGRGSDQFPLRLPDGMRDKIAEAAERNGRSMNSEIIARIDAYESGGAVAEEWQRRYEQELEARQRLERQLDELIVDAKLLRDATELYRGHISINAGMIRMLADVIQKLETKPPPHIVGAAETAEKHAKKMLHDLGTPDPTIEIIRMLTEAGATIPKLD